MAILFNPLSGKFDFVSQNGLVITAAAFTTMQPITGTSPVATGVADTLTFASTGSSISISGNSGTDTLDFTINPNGAVVDNTIARWDGTQGRLQGSLVTIDDAGAITGVGGLTIAGLTPAGVVHNDVSGLLSTSLIVNADVHASAAISRSKLASGTANHVIVNDGSGVLSSQAVLDETKGGTNQSTYATGDIIYASAANTLSKRTIGAAGTVLKAQSTGVPDYKYIVDAPTELFMFEDWVGDAVGVLRWLDADVGTGVSATTTTVLDNAHPGVLELNTGASATGSANRFLGGVTTGAATSGFIVGGGQIVMEWLVRIPVLSDGTQQYAFDVGLFDNATGNTNSIRFLYATTVSTNWIAGTTSASTNTNTDTGVVVAINTWYRLQAVINAAGTSVEFFINGVSVATNVTNIPTVVIAPRSRMLKSIGTTARIVYIDYFWLHQQLTTSR